MVELMEGREITDAVFKNGIIQKSATLSDNPNLKRKGNENHDVYTRDTKKKKKENARNEFKYASRGLLENEIKRIASQCSSNNDASSSSSTVSSHMDRVDEEQSGVITRYGIKHMQPEQTGKRFYGKSTQCMSTNDASSSSNVSSPMSKVDEEHSVVITRYGSKQIQPEQIGKRFNAESTQCMSTNDASSSSNVSSPMSKVDEEHSVVITRYGSKQIQPEQIGKRFNAESRKLSGKPTRKKKKNPVQDDNVNSSMSSPIAELDTEYSGVITRSVSNQIQSQLARKRFNMENDLTWEKYMNTRSLIRARRLLKRGYLPVWKEFEHFYFDASYKNIFLLTCQHISNHIKATSDNILQVYPAYRADDTKSIVFVVITKVESDTVVSRDYPVMCRCVGEYSNEGQDITTYRLCNKIYLTSEDDTKLENCIHKNSEQLTKEHSNLNMISGCTCISTKYGSEKYKPIDEVCIVLHVHAKGMIPIYEKQFKTHIDGIRVDVREGGFQFYGGANIRQEQLRIGCQIGNYMSGTLGAFIDYKNTTCCITSAHVILNDKLMCQLTSKKSQHSLDWDFTNGPKVFQPNTREEKDIVGTVIKAIYRPGKNKETGIEIVFIAVHNRHPVSGRFPEEEDTGENSQLQFSSGEICHGQCPVGSEVLMFGCGSSKFTKGRVVSNTLYIQHEDRHLGSGLTFPLGNQVVIESVSSQAFAKPGDSGAVVFRKFHENGSRPVLKAFGILEGSSSDGKYLVTPIWDILESLGHPQLTNFETSSLEERIIKLEGTMNQQFQELKALIVERTVQNNC